MTIIKNLNNDLKNTWEDELNKLFPDLSISIDEIPTGYQVTAWDSAKQGQSIVLSNSHQGLEEMLDQAKLLGAKYLRDGKI